LLAALATHERLDFGADSEQLISIFLGLWAGIGVEMRKSW
jgi:hypothetical protein